MKRILCVSERPHGVVAHFVFVPPPTTGTVRTRPTLHHGARPDQSERENHAVRRQCEAFGYAGCTGLAVAHLRANGMEITRIGASSV